MDQNEVSGAGGLSLPSPDKVFIRLHVLIGEGAETNRDGDWQSPRYCKMHLVLDGLHVVVQ
jgi:hypothetical protein